MFADAPRAQRAHRTQRVAKGALATAAAASVATAAERAAAAAAAATKDVTDFVFNPGTAALRQQWNVTKINSMGRRQERVLGMDLVKLYNSHPEGKRVRRVRGVGIEGCGVLSSPVPRLIAPPPRPPPRAPRPA